MIAFISGPMTGHPDFNRSAFYEAEDELFDMGYEAVYNPAKSGLPDDASHERCMLETLSILTRKRDGKPLFDCIVMLDGWESSKGSKLEHDIAEAIGINVMTKG